MNTVHVVKVTLNCSVKTLTLYENKVIYLDQGWIMLKWIFYSIILKIGWFYLTLTFSHKKLGPNIEDFNFFNSLCP